MHPQLFIQQNIASKPHLNVIMDIPVQVAFAIKPSHQGELGGTTKEKIPINPGAIFLFSRAAGWQPSKYPTARFVSQ